jgi:hypothetical protein
VKTGELMLAVALVLFASGMFYSVLMLCANKYGHEEFRRLPSLYSEPDAAILVSGTLSGSFIDVLRYYDSQADIIRLNDFNVNADEMIPVDYGRPTYSLIHRSEVTLESLPEYQRQLLLSRSVNSDKYALVLFGFVFYEAPMNQHFFTNTPLQVVGGLPPTTFGVKKLAGVPELYLVKLKPGERLFKTADGGYSIRSETAPL